MVIVVQNLTSQEIARIAQDAKTEADMSKTPEERGQAMQDMGSIMTPVPAQLHGLTGEINPMRDSFILKGMTIGERVDAATSDLPDDVKTWSEDEIIDVERAISDLQSYVYRARAAHYSRKVSSLPADPDAFRYMPQN